MLSRRVHSWPYAVGRVFREPDGGDPASVIVQSGSGGIITGDALAQRIVARADAHARVLGQGAVSVHRSRTASGAVASSGEQLRLRVEPGAWLENLAEPRVLFGGAEFTQATVIELDGGVALSLEAVVVRGGEGDAVYRSDVEVHRGGELVARERVRARVSDLPAGTTAFALLVCAGLPWDAAAWAEWAASAGAPDCYAAASELPFDAGVGVRVAAADGSRLRAALDGALAVSRVARVATAPRG